MTSINSNINAQLNRLPSELIHHIQDALSNIETVDGITGLKSLSLSCQNMKDHLDDRGRLTDVGLRHKVLKNQTSLEENLSYSVLENRPLLNHTATIKVCSDLQRFQISSAELNQCCVHANKPIRIIATNLYFHIIKNNLPVTPESAVKYLTLALTSPAPEIKQKAKELLIEWFEQNLINPLDNQLLGFEFLLDQDIVKAYCDACIRRFSPQHQNAHPFISSYFLDFTPNQEIADAARNTLVSNLDQDRILLTNDSVGYLTNHDHPNIRFAALAAINRHVERADKNAAGRHFLPCLKEDRFLQSQYMSIRKASFQLQLQDLKQQNKIHELLGEKYAQHRHADIRNLALQTYIKLIGSTHLPINLSTISQYCPHENPDIEAKAITIFLKSLEHSQQLLLQVLPHNTAKIQQHLIKHIIKTYPSRYTLENLITHADETVQKDAEKYILQSLETGKLDDLIASKDIFILQNQSIEHGIIDRIAEQLRNNLRSFDRNASKESIIQMAENKAYQLISEDIATHLGLSLGTRPPLSQLESITNDESAEPLTQFKAAQLISRSLNQKMLDQHIFEHARFLDNQNDQVRQAAHARAIELVHTLNSTSLKEILNPSQLAPASGLVTILKNATQFRYSQPQQDIQYFELPNEPKKLVDALDTRLQSAITNGELDSYVSDFQQRHQLTPAVLKATIEQRLLKLIKTEFNLSYLLRPELLQHHSEQIRLHTYFRLTQELEKRTEPHELLMHLMIPEVWQIKDKTLELTLNNKVQLIAQSKDISKAQLKSLRDVLPPESRISTGIDRLLEEKSKSQHSIKNTFKSGLKIFKKK